MTKHPNDWNEIFEGIFLRIAEDLDALPKIEQILKSIDGKLGQLVPPKAQSATLTFKGETGMPATIQVGGTATATYLEWSGPNGTGQQVPPTGTVSYLSDNTSVATVDPNTGIATGVSAGTANISGNDSGLPAPGLIASDVLTVTAAPPPPAVSSTLTLVANSSFASRRA